MCLRVGNFAGSCIRWYLLGVRGGCACVFSCARARACSRASSIRSPGACLHVQNHRDSLRRLAAQHTPHALLIKPRSTRTPPCPLSQLALTQTRSAQARQAGCACAKSQREKAVERVRSRPSAGVENMRCDRRS